MCLFPNSAETTDPNELKFCGMISLRMGGFRLKNIQVWSTVCRKSSYPKESSSIYSRFASIFMQPLVYHNVTAYMCTLLFSPSSSLLFLIFINKSYFQRATFKYKYVLHPFSCAYMHSPITTSDLKREGKFTLAYMQHILII